MVICYIRQTTSNETSLPSKTEVKLGLMARVEMHGFFFFFRSHTHISQLGSEGTSLRTLKGFLQPITSKKKANPTRLCKGGIQMDEGKQQPSASLSKLSSEKQRA